MECLTHINKMANMNEEKRREKQRKKFTLGKCSVCRMKCDYYCES